MIDSVDEQQSIN